MLKTIVKRTLVAALITFGIHDALAENIQVNITGTIVPGACTPTLSGGGIIDYGNIIASTLSADEYTTLRKESLDFAINCAAPSYIAIRAINDRPGTMAGDTETAEGYGFTPRAPSGDGGQPGVGLGLDGITPIGGYSVNILPDSVLADGIAVDTIVSSRNGEWNTSPSGSVFPGILSWSEKRVATGGRIPDSFRVLTGTLSVQAYINHSSELDLSHAIHLDGQTTLEVVYL